MPQNEAAYVVVSSATLQLADYRLLLVCANDSVALLLAVIAVH